MKNVTKAEYLAAVTQGVFEAVREIMPVVEKDEILEAIREGITDGMPWPTEILNALAAGARDATREKV